MEQVLQITGLKIEFLTAQGMTAAVKSADLSVGRGETVVLAGESGSGKSLTALSVAGLLPAGAIITQGEIVFGGKDMRGLTGPGLEAVRGSKVAYIFQEPASYLDPVYTIGSQISEALVAHRGLRGNEAGQETLRLLGLVRISDPGRVARSYPHQLSGGMNQRASIAIALACRPQLLIADEPTTSLDVTVEDQIIRLLCGLKAELGFSLLFITHNLSIARRIADRIVVMHRGETVEEGGREKIFSGPRHPHTKELIAAYERIGRLS
jgi:ABC-type glutathione transport system ATPase component